jgi:hypothetical protein
VRTGVRWAEHLPGEIVLIAGLDDLVIAQSNWSEHLPARPMICELSSMRCLQSSDEWDTEFGIRWSGRACRVAANGVILKVEIY